MEQKTLCPVFIWQKGGDVLCGEVMKDQLLVCMPPLITILSQAAACRSKAHTSTADPALVVTATQDGRVGSDGFILISAFACLWPQVSYLNSVLLMFFMAPFCNLFQALWLKRLLQKIPTVICIKLLLFRWQFPLCPRAPVDVSKFFDRLEVLEIGMSDLFLWILQAQCDFRTQNGYYFWFFMHCLFLLADFMFSQISSSRTKIACTCSQLLFIQPNLSIMGINTGFFLLVTATVLEEGNSDVWQRSGQGTRP